MITLVNKTTGESINVSKTTFNGENVVGKKVFTARFFNKYTMLTKVSETPEGYPVMVISDEWEVAKTARKPRTKKSDATNDSPANVEPANDEPQVVDEPTIEPDATSDATPAKTKKARKPRTKKAAPDVAPTTNDATNDEPQVDAPKVDVAPEPVTLPSQSAFVDAFSALTPLFAGVQKNVVEEVMNMLRPYLERVEAACNKAPQQITHVIKTDGATNNLPAGTVLHPNFNDVCSRVAAGMWVYLYGPTGSGKNVMAEQIATALGLNFYYQAHVLDRFELVGFIDANGNYHETPFYKAAKNGGLYMLDEADASDENAFVTLNSASNGYVDFPCGRVEVHKDFRVIAAGNTCGRGATSDYTARRVLDASSLGRFVTRFHGYCHEIDMAAANDNEELVTFAVELRKIKAKTGTQMLISPRQIKAIVSDESRDLNLSQTLIDVFVPYLTRDELNIVKHEVAACVELAGNKYAKAFISSKVQAVEY